MDDSTFQPSSPQAVTEAEEQGWGVGIHLGGFIAWVIAPLVMWLVFRSRSRMLNEHGKTTLNWQIALIIVAVPLAIIAVVLMFLIDPLVFLAIWVIMALLGICVIVFAIRGAIAAYNRRPYRYPLSIPFFT